ncbi:unnamed protein product [Meganyctiphanes norvegica]|uniref:Uncharacterized protein n=1 Tax=Meganyctiphanes norvegica TaxID=48144 RepID=A0AAV2PUS0_MEGNR
MMELLNSKSSTSSKNSDNQKPLSVMLMGLDSTSRNNLQRYLPKTFAYLKESKAIDPLGYNKVGDNTFPNLLSLLPGLQEKTILQKFTNGVRKGPFDKCTFLWNNFSTLGYVTAYGEDSVEDGTFNYMKTGYVSPPTDLYLPPFIQASEDLIGYYTNKL